MIGRRWLVWLGVVLAVLLVGGIVGWILVASRLRSDVEASLAQPIRCTGTTIVTRRPVPGERPIRMVALVPGMRCTVRIRVVNNGFLPVRIQTAAFGILGPGAGPGAILSGPDETSRQFSVDAAFGIDRVLQPGDSLEATYTLGFRPKGCDSPRATEWLRDVPRIAVSALWRSGAVAGTGSLGWIGTAASSCDEP